MSNLFDAPVTESIDHIVEVHVAHAANGGWDVIAMSDERVLAAQHCDDWHRAERAYRRMKADVDLRLDVLTRETIAALFAV